MFRFIVRRLVLSIPILLLVSIAEVSRITPARYSRSVA